MNLGNTLYMPFSKHCHFREGGQKGGGGSGGKEEAKLNSKFGWKSTRLKDAKRYSKLN